jgi:hypothetical protein
MTSNDNTPHMDALLQLVAHLETQIISTGESNAKLLREALHKLETSQPLIQAQALQPMPESPHLQFMTSQPINAIQPLPEAPPHDPYFYTRIVDQLSVVFPALYQIRPYTDSLTWRKLLLMLAVLVAIAQTPLATAFGDALPVLKTPLQYAKIASYFPATPIKKDCTNDNANIQPTADQKAEAIQSGTNSSVSPAH